MEKNFIEIDELKMRLCNLVLDLSCDYDKFQKYVYISSLSQKDRTEYFKDMYMKDQMPVKIVDFDRAYVKRDHSFEFYDNFIMGLDEYIKREERIVDETLNNYYIANKIFRCILEIKSPESDILYLLYLKKISNKEAMSRLYISKPTYYRMKQKGMSILLSKINSTQ